MVADGAEMWYNRRSIGVLGMKNLDDIRKEINAIDDELTALFLRRLEIARDVAEAKRASGKPIFDPARERAILSHVAGKVGAEYENDARLLFNTLFTISRTRQRNMLARTGSVAEEIVAAQKNTPQSFPSRASVACQGTEGSYSQQAACRLFAFPEITFMAHFEDVFRAVEDGKCRYGVLPIENSTAGSVTPVYDLMLKHNFKIVRAIRQRINHVLLAPRGVKIDDIKEVASHPQALAQCSEYLMAHKEWKISPSANTAVAAKAFTAEAEPRKDLAVIASRACAQLYGLDIIATDIANTQSNYTRFIVISKDLEVYRDAQKFTIQLALDHKPGALYGVMAKFAAINVNLTKLENRPIPGTDFEMQFTFDFEASPGEAQVLRLLTELAEDPEVVHFAFLGAYAET